MTELAGKVVGPGGVNYTQNLPRRSLRTTCSGKLPKSTKYIESSTWRENSKSLKAAGGSLPLNMLEALDRQNIIKYKGPRKAKRRRMGTRSRPKRKLPPASISTPMIWSAGSRRSGLLTPTSRPPFCRTLHSTARPRWMKLDSARNWPWANCFDVDGARSSLALGSVLGKRLTSDPFGQDRRLRHAQHLAGGCRRVHRCEPDGVEPLDRDPEGRSRIASGSTLLSNIKGAGIGALSSVSHRGNHRSRRLGRFGGEVAGSGRRRPRSPRSSPISPSSATASTPLAWAESHLGRQRGGIVSGHEAGRGGPHLHLGGGQIGTAVGAGLWSAFKAAPLFQAAVATSAIPIFAAAVVAVAAIGTLLGGLDRIDLWRHAKIGSGRGLGRGEGRIRRRQRLFQEGRARS